jgi:hypothetical protein
LVRGELVEKFTRLLEKKGLNKVKKRKRNLKKFLFLLNFRGEITKRN